LREVEDKTLNEKYLLLKSQYELYKEEAEIQIRKLQAELQAKCKPIVIHY